MRQKYEIFSYQQVYLQNYLRVIFYTLFFWGDKIFIGTYVFPLRLARGGSAVGEISISMSKSI